MTSYLASDARKKAAPQAAFFLYGPRFLATGSGTSAAISSNDHTCLDTPASIAGVTRSGALSVRRDAAESGGAQIPLYLAFKNLLPFVNKHLDDVHITPVRYKTAGGDVGDQLGKLVRVARALGIRHVPIVSRGA